MDKKRKDLIVSSKAQCVLVCQECFKPHRVYSKNKFKPEQKAAIEELQESHLYTCGSSLFPPESPLSTEYNLCSGESDL